MARSTALTGVKITARGYLARSAAPRAPEQVSLQGRARPQRVHCGEACWRKWWSRWQSEWRKVQPHKTTCDGCGTTFLAHHSDARFCLSACKQRAYRSALRLRIVSKPDI